MSKTPNGWMVAGYDSTEADPRWLDAGPWTRHRVRFCHPSGTWALMQRDRFGDPMPTRYGFETAEDAIVAIE